MICFDGQNHCRIFKLMETLDLQQGFFRHIRSVMPAHLSYVDEIAELLGISNDSAYRRIRGEKALSFEEIQKLSKKFNISLDQVMNLDSNSILFKGNNVESDSFNLEQYLLEMLRNIQLIKSAKHKMLYYEAKDFPIFYYFQHTELAAFKYFFWMKTVLSYPGYNKMYFEDNELVDVMYKSGASITEAYTQVPSCEIMGVESIHATLRQIEYYHYARVFRKKETIEMLYDQLTQLMEHIREQAECGEKFVIGRKPTGDVNNYKLYFNEIFLGHNSIVVETDNIMTTYINHGVLNYMYTHDDKFCTYTLNSMENAMKKSNLISTINEKERIRFFSLMNDRVAESRQKVLG